jgi:hypothetical protein
MKSSLVIVACAFAALTLSQIAMADEEFYGIIESRPDNTVGTWIVGGRSFDVTEHTKLDEDHGRLVVGACADIETDEGLVEGIESEPADKCRK